MLEYAYWPRVIDRKLLKILHTSDVHIGSDTYPREALEGLEKLLSMADSLAVDALLIAGDLFDRSTVPNKIVEYVFTSLSNLKCPVVVLPGNHDTLLTSDSFEQSTGQNGTHAEQPVQLSSSTTAILGGLFFLFLINSGSSGTD